MGTGHAGRRAVFHFCASVVHARFVHACRAGADIAFAGRTGRGLILSRCNKRRAKQRRHNKSRDCQF